ncbi:MAG: HAD-IA family hydrolase [Dehalococcoidales bacterium]|nr:HAD-IA family hydrolase [Dehalococcoidales bacterium]
MIKAVFFDLYQTLLRYEPPREEAFAEVLGGFGISISPDSLRLPIATADEFFYKEHARFPMSKRTEEERRAMWAQYQEMVLREAGLTPTHELIAGVLAKMQQIKFKQSLFDDVLPALNELKKRGLVLGLISNIDRDMTPVLDKLGLTPMLDVIVTSGDSGYAKPQPEIFHKAVEQAGVQKHEAVFVGDQYEIDVVGATRAGLKGILLDRYGSFEEVGQDRRIQSLYHLIDYLSRDNVKGG